jgi:hypothetical protein
MEGRPRRRLAAPVALVAALAIAAGGGSSPLALRPAQPGTAARSVAVPLDHIELVAMRAQAAPPETADTLP